MNKYNKQVNLGWKLWGGRRVGDKASIVFSANPFMGYSKYKRTA